MGLQLDKSNDKRAALPFDWDFEFQQGDYIYIAQIVFRITYYQGIFLPFKMNSDRKEINQAFYKI